MNRSIETAVSGLTPVSLDGLNNVAELQTRKDRKYIVPLEDLVTVIADSDLSVLEIEGRRSFRYESVYFDTPGLLTYKAAAHKRRRRFKVRTRSYMESGLCWIEVKMRSGRGLNDKHRLPYDITDRRHLTDEGLDFIKGFETVAAASAELEPVLTTRYSRITLLDTETSSRVTVDMGFEAEDAHGDIIGLSDVAIVETKTDGKPCSIDHALWRIQRRPVKISKFATGLAALTPGLPANKWNRVLREHFGWVPAKLDGAAQVSTTRKTVATSPTSIFSRSRTAFLTGST